MNSTAPNTPADYSSSANSTFPRSLRFSLVALATSYLLTLVLYYWGGSSADGRIWGVNLWGIFAENSPLIFLAIGAVAFVLILLWIRIIPGAVATETQVENRVRLFVIGAGGIGLILTALFVIFRAQTYFLGDGYTLLALLESDNPLVKGREIGEALIHIWVKGLFFSPGESETAALLSFQTISIFSGALFVSLAIFFSARFRAPLAERFLLFLGLISGGYALLFFGYVENYSLFVLSVFLFTVIGTLAQRGLLSPWLIVPALALTCWLHILGVTLIPAALYLLLRNSRLSRTLADWPLSLSLALGAALVATLIGVAYFISERSFFFQTALVPLAPTRFTVEGYTFFSAAHLLDLANLALILCPWVLLALSAFFWPALRQTLSQEKPRFLLIMSLCAVGAVMIFDPKVGMPRDWDLFCFAGVPLSALWYLTLLDSGLDRRLSLPGAALSLTLALLVLVPRVAELVSPKKGLERFESYLTLDKTKNRTGIQLLQDFHLSHGDSALALEIASRYRTEFPEVAISLKSMELKKAGNLDSALQLNRRAIEMNPIFGPAYSNLGQAYAIKKNYDSAMLYLRIAEGLNPYNPRILEALGYVRHQTGDIQGAFEAWSSAILYDSSVLKTYLNLITVSKELGYTDRYHYYLERVTRRDDAPKGAYTKLAESYIELQQFDSARSALQRGLEAGLEKVYVRRLVKKHPQLRPKPR